VLLLLSIPCLGFLHTIAVEYGIQMKDHFFDTICSKEKFASFYARKKEKGLELYKDPKPKEELNLNRPLKHHSNIQELSQ